MRRGCLSSCVMFASVVAGLAAGADAALVQLTATGTVTSSNLGAFAVSQTMTMVLRYETTGGPQFIANQQAFYVDHITYIGVSCGAWNTSATGAFGQIVKYDNLGGYDGIQFQAAANPLTYQYTNPKPQGVALAGIGGSNFDNVILNLASFNAGLWNNFDLPSSYTFSDFTATQNALFAFDNGGFMIGWGAVQSEIIPGPGAGALLGVSALLRRGRRRG